VSRRVVGGVGGSGRLCAARGFESAAVNRIAADRRHVRWPLSPIREPDDAES
jgi:hypothetical protein